MSTLKKTANRTSPISILTGVIYDQHLGQDPIARTAVAPGERVLGPYTDPFAPKLLVAMHQITSQGSLRSSDLIVLHALNKLLGVALCEEHGDKLSEDEGPELRWQGNEWVVVATENPDGSLGILEM